MNTVEDYRSYLPELRAYLSPNWLTSLANFSALAFHSLPELNWSGFYLYDGVKLRLGPFAGKPACMEIQVGRGVCGTAFSQCAPLVVPDVHEFPGHIACDSASRSELVVPFVVDGEAIGVFDLDSPSLNHFSSADAEGIRLWLEELPKVLPAQRWKDLPWG